MSKLVPIQPGSSLGVKFTDTARELRRKKRKQKPKGYYYVANGAGETCGHKHKSISTAFRCPWGKWYGWVEYRGEHD